MGASGVNISQHMSHHQTPGRRKLVRDNPFAMNSCGYPPCENSLHASASTVLPWVLMTHMGTAYLGAEDAMPLCGLAAKVA